MHPGPYNPPPGAYMPPPPYGRNVPRYGHPGGGSRRGGCSCLKVYCCCCCCLFITIALVIGAFVAGYFIVDPKAPKFSIEGFESKSFNFDAQKSSITSELQATVKFENPNKHLEFKVRDAKDQADKSIVIYYSNVKVTSGIIPTFDLNKKNTKTVTIDLKGELKKDDLAQGSFDTLTEKLKNNEKIPLLVATMIPLKVKLSGLGELTRIHEVRFGFNITMNVNNFGEGKKLDISDKKSEMALYVDKNYFKFRNGNIF